jgi:hypothetical protein
VYVVVVVMVVVSLVKKRLDSTRLGVPVGFVLAFEASRKSR